MEKKLIEKFVTKEARIGIVGLGYVGLPLAVEVALSGYKVYGIDTSVEKVDNINKGINYIADVSDDNLLYLVNNKQLIATSDFQVVKKLDAIIICVPTPLDEFKQPNMRYVISSVDSIVKHMDAGTLIILESTTYPGTTDEIIKSKVEEKGFKVGEDVFIAYSPERVDPGNSRFNTKNTPKVVGGVTNNCTNVASAMYEEVLDSNIYRVSSPAVAEMEKLLENTFRNINIGLVNELAIICNKMSINVWEVIDAAATKPYGFMPFYPGPGLGGHCIPVDPWYLEWKAKEYNINAKLIQTSGEINDSMPDYVLMRLMDLLNEQGKAMKLSNILVVGVAYKKDISDYRESPALPIIESIINRGANCAVIDPFVKEFVIGEEKYYSTELTKEKIQKADVVLILTNHSKVDYNLISQNANLILDTRNVFKDIEKYDNYYLL